MIEELTEEQRQRFREFREKWWEIGLRAGVVERDAAIAAVAEAYRCAGLQPPRQVVFCASPVGLALIALEQEIAGRSWAEVLGCFPSPGKPYRLPSELASSAYSQTWTRMWKIAVAGVLDEGWQRFQAEVRARTQSLVEVVPGVLGPVRAEIQSVIGAVRRRLGLKYEDLGRFALRAGGVRPRVRWVRHLIKTQLGAQFHRWLAGNLNDGHRRRRLAEECVSSALETAWKKDRVLRLTAGPGEKVRGLMREVVERECLDRLDQDIRSEAMKLAGRCMQTPCVSLPLHTGWLSAFDFLAQVAGRVEETAPVRGLWQVAAHTGGILPFTDVCLVAERPQIVRVIDLQDLHGEDGPVLAYWDGWGVYALYGDLVPEHFVLRPDEITVDEIDYEQNRQVRHFLLERYGRERYVQNSGAQVVASDRWGTLYRREVPGREPICFVRVTNATPEPDGSYKEYLLRVPPGCETPLEAVAWTFQMPPDEYARLLEKET